ncbi:glycosyltransferase [Patescibacteria group bacterium]|nr:glycosyltransferase [Patescibacteria group bacterium]
MAENKKIAIVYDWFDKWGGVERVLLTFKEMFPEADFFTSYLDLKGAGWARDLNVKTSFIQDLPEFIRKRRLFSMPFYPLAFESFDFSDYDLVISVTSSFAKSIISGIKTKHICYLLTPTRFLWSHKQDYFRENFFNKFYVSYLKNWDVVVSQRPDQIISISETVRERCLRYYRRDSLVIYPPFDVNYWRGLKSEAKNEPLTEGLKINNYFLIVSRLEKYKKIDLAISVFNKSKKKLVVVGEGSEENYLKKISGKNISFFPKLSDRDLAKLYSHAESLIMPQEEDFGYVSLEAQFFGCPVISFAKGGGTETVSDGKSGVFFREQKAKSLLEAVERFTKISYNLKDNLTKFPTEVADKFSKENFMTRFKSLL